MESDVKLELLCLRQCSCADGDTKLLLGVGLGLVCPQVFARTEIKAEAGSDVLLQCQSSRGSNVELIKLIRPDLYSGGYVLFSRENRTYEEYQHPYFRGRVELRDVEMMNLSVILKNVTGNDTGTYEWYVAVEGRSKLICTNNLTVITSGDTNKKHGDGGTMEGPSRSRNGLIILAFVFGVLAFGFGVWFFFCLLSNRNKKTKQDCVV